MQPHTGTHTENDRITPPPPQQTIPSSSSSSTALPPQPVRVQLPLLGVESRDESVRVHLQTGAAARATAAAAVTAHGRAAWRLAAAGEVITSQDWELAGLGDRNKMIVELPM